MPQYNLIMHGDPNFWVAENGTVSFPKERFLEYTEDSLKEQFKELTPQTIKAIKKLPTLFATEHEEANTRIGKIKDIKVNGANLVIQYEFDTNFFPLVKGTLEENSNDLGLNNVGQWEFYRTHWAIKEADITAFYQKYLTTLTGIAQQIEGAKNTVKAREEKKSDVKVQLIYAFNGVGKTRLSREFRLLIDPKSTVVEADEVTSSFSKVIYYNAFTEDLFYWFNDLDNDTQRELRTHPNGFTDWLVKFLQDQGLDQKIRDHFQRYTSDKLTPNISPNFSKVDFTFNDGTTQKTNVKISKGEESNFIWSVFYSLLEQIIEERNITDISDRSTPDFNDLEYIFIDDPVSSLDENHLIELAVDLAKLIKSSKSKELKFIISTHSPLFYNVLYNEFGKPEFKKYILSKTDDGSIVLKPQHNDSPFSYHLFLKKEIEQAIQSKNIQKYHFNFLRNILEKSSTFLGMTNWKDLLPEDKKHLHSRVIDISSHSKYSAMEASIPTPEDIEDITFLMQNTPIFKLFK